MSNEQEIPDRMYGLVKTKDEIGYDFDENMIVPHPIEDEVLIKVESVSLCGSDLVLWNWTDAAKVIASIPFTPGHECCGTVVKCGPESKLQIGDRVAVENHFFCGKCHQCKHDRGDICSDMGQYGHGKKTPYGGCSQYSIVSSKYCYKLGNIINADEAALLEPLGVAHNAVENLGDLNREDVLIIGAGPIGLMAIPCVKSCGANRVIICDINEKRLQFAKEMGADHVINTNHQNLSESISQLTNGDGIGRLIECSGAVQIASIMFQLVRKGGHIVLVGLVKQPLIIENYMRDLVFKSIQIRGIHGRRIFHTWRETEKLVESKRVDISKLISHKFQFKDYKKAFEILLSGEAHKIILTP
ncbi:DgyrCDS14211 [Dimorphilus gyrociliatus]|uniref:DgyrCDS14211 n=1 Tax=Dimorphilus gyrociliatus TaxID=2664684 RepID=A0A7I8WCZ5_9ANNE|nr:DgyrCDS14211 [Dimorphilus gyrociliatus]